MTARFDGDASLRRRPMRRPLQPQSADGCARIFCSRRGAFTALARWRARDHLRILNLQRRIASAQLKSAVLLSGLAAPGETVVVEAEATRDHTERRRLHFGVHPAFSNPWGDLLVDALQ